MKYGYIYVGVSVAIVVIGIFLIFQFESTKQNSNCMSIEEAKLFYSQFNITLKFPQYLPNDYRHKCSMFETPNEVISFYDNRNFSMNPPRSETDLLDFYKNGGLYFEYDKSNSNEYYSVLSRIENGTIPHPLYNYSEINGNPAIVSGGMYFGSTIYINSIAVYTKDSLSKVEGNFTMVELKKVAESIR